MKFKELEWKGHISEGMVISSDCVVKVYGYTIKMEFRIAHNRDEEKYYLCSFGKGSVRRLQPDVFDSLDEAKSAAYGIYNNEMRRVKKAVDYLVVT